MVIQSSTTIGTISTLLESAGRVYDSAAKLLDRMGYRLDPTTESDCADRLASLLHVHWAYAGLSTGYVALYRLLYLLASQMVTDRIVPDDMVAAVQRYITRVISSHQIVGHPAYMQMPSVLATIDDHIRTVDRYSPRDIHETGIDLLRSLCAVIAGVMRYVERIRPRGRQMYLPGSPWHISDDRSTFVIAGSTPPPDIDWKNVQSIDIDRTVLRSGVHFDMVRYILAYHSVLSPGVDYGYVSRLVLYRSVLRAGARLGRIATIDMIGCSRIELPADWGYVQCIRIVRPLSSDCDEHYYMSDDVKQDAIQHGIRIVLCRSVHMPTTMYNSWPS